MSAVLSGSALVAAQALAQGFSDDHELIIFLGPERGLLDESTIDEGWLPGAGWTDHTADVLLSAGITIAVTALGAEITLTVSDESRQVWSDDRSIAIVARHWLVGNVWGPYYLEAWGYLPGSGQDTYTTTDGARAQRKATYSGYWDRLRLVAQRLGRRNLAAGASIHAASTPLATPLAEAPLEYLAQDDCAPAKAIDQFADTVAVADAFADPAIPTIGETYVPKILRVGGPDVRGVAAGGIPRFVEFWAGYDILRYDTKYPAANQWGTFNYPLEIPWSEGNDSATISNDLLDATPVSGKYVIHAKRQATNQNNSVYVQWNIASDPIWYGVPALLSFKVKAGATANIGDHMLLQWGHSGTNHDVLITLSAAFQQIDVPIDALASTGSVAGGMVLRFRAWRDDLYLRDVYYELDDLHLWVGYNGANYTKSEGKALFLALDDGAGNQRLERLANLNNGNEIDIPPRGSIIVCDDKATFEQRYGNTGATILQLKGDYPQWFFAPGVGRMRLAYGNDPARTNYDDTSLSGAVVHGVEQPIEEILFSVANGGAPWTSVQALSRQNPIGTGYLAVEDFAHIGLVPPFGAAYWWIDLGAFVAPKLTADITASSARIPVDNADYYTDSGLGYLGTEHLWWIGKDGNTLLVHQRGIFGTSPVAHLANTPLIPDSYGGLYQNMGIPQTGHNVDQIEIRRKPGTPLILAGAVIASDLTAPGDPSVGGARWEFHPDWFLVQRFSDRQGNPDVLTMSLIDILGGPREMRHVCLVIDGMERVGGIPQRAKVNEIVVREWRAAGGAAGGWVSHAVADLGGALAHVLTQHGALPASKVTVAGAMPPIGDLTVAPSMVGAALTALGGNDGVRVRLDKANAAIIEPEPLNPAYTATVPYWTWTSDLVAGPLAGGWENRRRVAQARVSAKDAASLRTYSTAYPKTAGTLGDVREVRDVRVLTAADAFARAVREFRAGNVRHSPITIPAGAVPWLRISQRHLLNLSALDTDGSFTDINVVVKTYTITIGIDDGGVTWNTSIQLDSLVLG